MKSFAVCQLNTLPCSFTVTMCSLVFVKTNCVKIFTAGV